MPTRHQQTIKIVLAFRLGLRSPFRVGSGGYSNFLRRSTLPNDDTGIVAVTVRRLIYFLTEKVALI
jgi:hypothetical protein